MTVMVYSALLERSHNSFGILGDKYDVPIFCINDPTMYDVPRETKFDRSEVKKATITVILDMSRSCR